MAAASVLKNRPMDFDETVSDRWTVGQLGRAVVWVCVAAVGLINTLDVNTGGVGAEESVGLDSVVAVKLALAGLCGLVALVGLASMPTARYLLGRGPGLLLVGLGGVLIATSAFAVPEVATVSRIASVLMGVYLGFAAVSLSVLGGRSMMRALLCGLIVNVLANWVIYLGFESIGVFTEDLGDGVLVRRMGGLGHPNAIARAAVLSSLIVVAIGRWRGRENGGLRGSFWSPGAAAVHLLTLATLYATVSRTAVVAGAAGVAMMVLDRLWSRRGAALGIAGLAALLIAVGFGWMWRDHAARTGGGVVGAVTKTGDVSELTTATGRTEIWTEAIRLIAGRPLTGYGLNSAPVMLEDFSYHTHNALLHAAFSGGIVAGAVMALLLLWNAVFGLTDREAWVRGITAFLLVSCLFEDTVLETFAGPPTIVWMVVLLMPALRSIGNGYNGPGINVSATNFEAINS